MKKKTSSLLASIALASMLSACSKAQDMGDAAHYPADTMCYFSAQNPEQAQELPQFEQFKKELYKVADLSDEVSAQLDAFLNSIDSVSFAIGKVNISPLSIEAGGILTADFTDEQIELLKSFYTKDLELTATDPINGYTVYSTTFTAPPHAETPFLQITSAELFVTLPKEGKIAIAATRSQLEFMLNDPSPNAPSLAKDADFNHMLETLEEGPKETVTFIRTQSYLNTVFDGATQVIKEATKTTPIPISIDAIISALKTNMRLQDWGNSIATVDTEQKYGVSKMEVTQDNPIYRQFAHTKELTLPHVPADVSQVTVCNMNDTEKGFNDLVGMINECAKLAIPPALGEPSALLEAQAGFKFADLASHLSGPISFWQSVNTENPQAQKMCICLGLKDAAAFKNFIDSIPIIAQLGIPESDGIYSPAPTAAWTFKENKFYFASSVEYLKQSLDTSSPNLFDSAEFKELRGKAHPGFNTIQYADYTGMMDAPIQQLAAQGLDNPALTAYLNLFKNMKTLQTGTAKDGMFVSETFMQY